MGNPDLGPIIAALQKREANRARWRVTVALYAVAVVLLALLLSIGVPL